LPGELFSAVGGRPPTKNAFLTRGENTGAPPRCGPVRRQRGLSLAGLASKHHPGIQAFNRQSLLITRYSSDPSAAEVLLDFVGLSAELFL